MAGASISWILWIERAVVGNLDEIRIPHESPIIALEESASIICFDDGKERLILDGISVED